MDDRAKLLRELGYSEKAIQYIFDETNYGVIENPTVHVRQQGDCGDMIELYVDIENDIIVDAKFQLVGCAGLQASGSTVTEMIMGMHVTEALKIDVGDIIDFAEGIPAIKLDCVETSRDALKAAVKIYLGVSDN